MIVFARITLVFLAVLGLAVWARVKAPASAGDAAVKVEWKEIVTEADIDKLVEESVKVLKEATKSASNFNLKSKTAQNEAYVLALYAEAAKRAGNGELAKKGAALQDAAEKLAEAAKKKRLDDAKKQVDIIAGFKTLKADGSAKRGDVELSKAIPIENLMENVNNVNKEFMKYRRLQAPAFSASGKPEEIALNSRKMAALTVAIEAHAPEKASEKKEWTETTVGVREAALEMAKAAKDRKANEWKEAYKRMDAACTKCHDVFRKE